MGLDYFRYYTRWHDHANRRAYDAPADPWRLVWVDPTEVEHFDGVSLLWGVGRVRGGDWDRTVNCRSITDTAWYRGLRQRFDEGRAWPDTAYYEWADEQFEEQDLVRGCADLEEFVAERCAAGDDLYETIREAGYRPNRGTVYDDVESVEYVSDLEPLASIGRDGRIVWTEGYHRLIVAKLLDLDEVPIYVLRRHERWQQIRDELDRTPADERPLDLAAHADHPDVQDVVS
jgi:hypothetical protein